MARKGGCILLKRWFYILAAIFVGCSALGKWLDFPNLLRFVFDCLAIVPLAGVMGRATESIAANAGPRLGGLLSATFGNAVELIIGIFALRQGLITLVKASITGSILGNLLFVLGVSFFIGGIRHPIQRFNIRAARSNAAMLILGVGIAFVLPAIFTAHESHVSLLMSFAVALVSFLIYILGLIFTLFTHREVFQYLDTSAREGESEATYDVESNLWISIVELLISTVFVGIESDWLVESVKQIAGSLGWSEMFIGVVVVAIIGNAAEHASAVWMAWKNRMDLSLEIAVGSSLQVAMFVAPLLFAASLILQHPMPLIFSWAELASLVSAVLLVVVLMVDGESNWLEGAMAVGAYLVMAVGFFTLPTLK